MQTQDLGSFFKAMYDLSKSAKNKDEFVMAASEKFGVLIEDIIVKASKKIGDEHTLQIDELKKAAEAKDAKISSLEEQVKLYDGRLLQLEKRVKASENREKRKQKAKVANNIMAKSSSAKSTKQVQEYIHKTINQGVEGTEKVKLQALLDNCDELVPKGGQGDRKAVKVYLTSEQKKALFAGLAKNNKTGSDHGITIQNEVPFYLRNYHKELDRVAFTLRTKYRQEKLRTKIIPDGLSLQMLFKSGDSQEWVKASSESLADKLESVVVYREEEKKPAVLPTCREIINRKDNYA